MSVPDPAAVDWVPLWNLGAPAGMVMVEDKILSADGGIDFTNIPATYKHLRLLASLRSAQSTVAGLLCRVNGDSGGNYDTPPTQNQTSFPLLGFLVGTDRTAGVHAALEMDFIDYASIAHHRGVVWHAGWYDGTSTLNHNQVGHWKNLAAAINRINLIPSAGVFAAGSRATLYALTDVGNPLQVPVMSLLQDIVLSSAQATIDFQSIPQTYKHLRLVGQLRGDTAAAYTSFSIRDNNDSTATNYATWGDRSNANSGGNNGIINGLMPAASAVANLFGFVNLEVPCYMDAIHKTHELRTGFYDTGAQEAGHYFGVWRNVAAINRLTMVPGAGNFAAGSRVSLYGIS